MAWKSADSLGLNSNQTLSPRKTNNECNLRIYTIPHQRNFTHLSVYIWVIPRQIYNNIFDCAENFFPRSIDDKQDTYFFFNMIFIFFEISIFNFSVPKDSFSSNASQIAHFSYNGLEFQGEMCNRVMQLPIFELNKVFLGSIIISSTLIHINCVKNLSKDCRQTVTCSKQNMLGSVIRQRRSSRAPPSSPVREIEYYISY